MSPQNPLDSETLWICSSCSITLENTRVKELIDTLENECQSLPPEKSHYESQVAKLKDILHPNHNLILDLEFSLCQMYGRERLDTQAEMVADGLKKRDICLHLLEVMDAVTPGMFRMRGMVLFDLYVVSMFLLKSGTNPRLTSWWKSGTGDQRSDPGKKMSQLEVKSELEVMQDVLRESADILGFEPPDSIEGKRAKTARTNVNYITDMIVNINIELNGGK